MDIAYVWPIGLVVLSNVFYNITAKSVPGDLNPFASLTITYIIGAAASFVLYFVFNRQPDLLAEYKNVNWAPVVMGICIVGLEAGYIFAYKAGWPVSTAAIVQSAFLGIILFIIGIVFFKEAFSWKKVMGLVICLVGLYFLNDKG